jgi:acyl-CoA thioesterase
MNFRFDHDTALNPPATGRGPGTWTGTMSPTYNIGDKPNGGYMLAVAVNAMTQGLSGPGGSGHPHPFSVNAHYLRPGESGPVSIDTETIRVGRTLSTATAIMHQNGKAKLQLIGTFGNLHNARGPSVVRGVPPELPPPDECIRRNTSPNATRLAISDSLDMRLHPSTGFITGKPSGTAEVTGWMRFADGREPDVLSLALFADAMPPTVFEVLPMTQWVPTVEFTVHFRGIPAPGWLRARFSTRYLVGGFFEEDGEVWDSTGQLVAQSRQLAMVLPAG